MKPKTKTNPRNVFVTAALVVTLALAISTNLRAADVTWNNNAANFLWNTTDANWSTGLWNNASIDNAFFGGTGVGAITVNAPINVSTLNFSPNGYSLSGTGPFTFVRGTSLNHLITGNIGVAAGATTPIDTPINSSIGLIKVGAGTLQLAGPPINFSGAGFPATAATNLLAADIYAGGLNGDGPGGTLSIMNSSVLPVTTRLGLANGLVDFGANNQTLASVTFINDQDNTPFNPATGSAGVGIIGTGTLRVTGEISVLSSPVSFNAGSNSIATNIDFGGGTQVIRTSGSPTLSLHGALQLTGVLSNGSLLKTFSVNPNGVMTNPDGMGLFGNNTYTGSTVLNGGPNIVTGTNASTSVQIAGPINGGLVSLQGANGSYLAASTILAASGGTLSLDNNANIGGVGSFSPTIPPAQNNNRVADSVEIQLRQGGFSYRGLANAPATETLGMISVLGGHNTITLATSGTGTTAVTVAGDLTMTPRSTLTLNPATLGGAVNRLFVNGTLPTADATGILPRIVTTTDLVTYNGATGLTPYTGYATDFSTGGTNVSVTAATAVNSSVNINALKRGTGSFAITPGSGVTLSVTSGMILSTGGTGTYTGGTIAFGTAPGAFFGTNTVNSALTGSSGLFNAAGTLTLNGDMSGLTGIVTQNGIGTTTLVTNTFGGSLEARQGALNINTSQTLAGQGAIILGDPANASNLVPANPTLSITGAGANAVIARDITVNNGGQTAAGIRYGDIFIPTLSVLSNVTGSQTVSGNITLSSPLRVNTTFGAGQTNFTGNIQGSSYLRLSSGRTVFSGNVSNSGGFYIGNGGGTVTANFTGTTTGSVPIDLVGSGADRTNVNYTAGTLPTGTITTIAVDSLSAPNLNPLDSSTINNPISLSGIGYFVDTGSLVAGAGNIGSNVGGGISATWAGPMSGIGGLIKTGVGILTLNNAANSYTGTTTINAGTLVAASDGSLGYGNVTLNAASVVLILQGGATNNYIADTATLSIGFASDTVNLNYTGADNINALIINGAPQATGTWGAPGSGAAHTDPIFTGTGILNVVLFPTVTGAVSRKNHGGTDFDLPLPLAPNQMAIEPRLGGATNDYTIIVTFGDTVSVSGKPQAELIGSGAVGSGGTPNGGMVTVSGNTVTIPLTNVTSQQVVQVKLNGVNGSSTVIIPMGVLVGDVNGNGAVTASDIGQTKALSGQPVSAANFRADVNTSGTINASDIGLVKSQSGASIP